MGGVDLSSEVRMDSEIQTLIDSRRGDPGRLQSIQDYLRRGKQLYNSDKIYLEKISIPVEPTPVSLNSDRFILLAALEQIIQWRLGDTGRLLHIYQTIQKRRHFYKSDENYLKTKLKSLFENNIISEDSIKSDNFSTLDSTSQSVSHLIQNCAECKKEIKLTDKTRRFKKLWFHMHCKLTEVSLASTTLQGKTFLQKQEQTQQKFQYDTVSQEEILKPAAKNKPDGYLVGLAVIIFGLLFFTAYSMFSYLSIIAISIAAALAFYHLLLAKVHSKEERESGKRRVSVTGFTVLVLPFVFGGIMAFDGYLNLMSITQVIFVWMLTLSFWQTMLFVPLAIQSVRAEKLIKEPTNFPMITILIPAYNEEKVIEITIESVINADYPKKEIIVIDDGSTDRTLEIASRYKDQVKILHKENGGKASALNYGLVFTTGEIISIIDADTIIGRQALKQIAKGFSNPKVAAVAGNIKIRNKMNWLTWCQALDYLTGIQIMRRALDYFGAITIVPGALGAFNKKRLEEAGAYDKGTIVEDFDATMKVLKSGLVVQASSTALAFTQAPQTLRDFYNQRKRWYRGNLQVLTRHSDALTNPRFGALQRFAYPLMIIHMLIIPATSIMVWGFAAYNVIIGQYEIVIFMVSMFIILQYLLGLMAIRIDGDDKKLVWFSVFLVLGYKQIVDVLMLKAAIEELFGVKPVWTSAKRVRS